jgi:hypothetical protein
MVRAGVSGVGSEAIRIVSHEFATPGTPLCDLHSSPGRDRAWAKKFNAEPTSRNQEWASRFDKRFFSPDALSFSIECLTHTSTRIHD